MPRPRRWLLQVLLGAALTSAWRPGVRAQVPDDETARKASAVLKGYPSFRRTTAASPAQIELGRELFFDKRLSRARTLGCVSCHDPAKSWGDGLPRAAAHGRELPRKTIRLVTTPFNRFLFWDGRTSSLEEAVLMPIQRPDEMDQDLPGLAAKLAAIPGYRAQFKKAFAGGAVTPENIGKALAAFILSIPVAEDSRFDRFRAEGAGLEAEEVKGLVLFMGRAGCGRCHVRSKFFHDVGLASAAPPDLGRFMVDPRLDNWKAFKTPSLRNVAKTAPYMHDGRFATLREVIDFYDRGGDDDRHKDILIRPLGLTEDEKRQLEAFLGALSTTVGAVAAPALPPDPG